MTKKEEPEDEDAYDLDNVRVKSNEPQEELKVGKKLSDLTTRRVIVLVLSMMFSVPVLTLTTYKDENNSFKFGLEMINNYTPYTYAFNASVQNYLDEHTALRTPVIKFSAYKFVWEADDLDLTALRSSEFELASSGENGELAAIFDLRANVQVEAGLGIARTIFICFVLAGGALMF